jgi:hypothetical protein
VTPAPAPQLPPTLQPVYHPTTPQGLSNTPVVISADPRLRYTHPTFFPPAFPPYDVVSGESAATFGGSGSASSDHDAPTLYDSEFSPLDEPARPPVVTRQRKSKQVVRIEWSRSQGKAADMEILDADALPLPDDLYVRTSRISLSMCVCVC